MKEKPLPLGRMMVKTKYGGKQRNYGLIFKVLAGILVLIMMVSVVITGFFHSPAPSLSYEGPLQPVSDLTFLADLSWIHGGEIQHEQVIFEEMVTLVANATDFVVADFFLFNDVYDRSDDSYPDLTRQLTDALIARKKEVPELQVVLITDEINNFYGSYEAHHLTHLQENGIEVVVTDPTVMGNSNPLYTGIWTTLISHFGSGDFGLFPNPFGTDAPRVTLRSYLRLMNFKANHRKVLITEEAALVMSANPHDASALHSNMAFRFSGPLAADLLETEREVAVLSGYDSSRFPTMPQVDFIATETQSDTQARVLTEGKIREHLLAEINQTDAGDSIWMGQFYIGDRMISQALLDAAQREVSIRLILDPNRDAFGIEKSGIPNRPAAAELVEASQGAIEIRWYNTQGEQYHTKLTLIHRGENSILFGGSANLTKRNLGDNNLETMIMVLTPRSGELSTTVTDYFRRLWGNRGGQYTLPYEAFEDSRAWRQWLYRFQEWSGFSTF
ncbi:phospholipase D family protein [Anoxynatronum buryatiense]|uniref:PLD-like domain-containing protein n=1 Tax=Anoxynatronum buryatiense TaxID=489973 RepID=A0AA45WVN4_9CLOT|nr:phospholipase D family protein [Anoxynatronum buryatiense]SMP54742.1 PLD-like domain-containing protein [Anoxynatronum buryatiense]